MITAVVWTRHDVSALAATLGALVSGVAHGLVGDAVVVTASPGEGKGEAAAVADALGAVFLVTPGDPWLGAARVARQDWLLCLEAGDVPGPGWMASVDRFLAADDGRLALLPRRPASVAAALTGVLEAALGASRVRAGFVVHRACLTEGRLVKRLRPARLAAVLERRAR